MTVALLVVAVLALFVFVLAAASVARIAVALEAMRDAYSQGPGE